MSFFNAPTIKLKDDKMNCPTKVYNWIKIVEYISNGESDYYLCIDKRVLNNNIFLPKYRNIMKLELPPSKITTNNKILNYIIVRLVNESILDSIRDIDYIKSNFAVNYHLFKIHLSLLNDKKIIRKNQKKLTRLNINSGSNKFNAPIVNAPVFPVPD